MSKTFLFTVDLISKGIFSPESLDAVKKSILKREEEGVLSDLCEIMQLTKDGRIEIYGEELAVEEDSGEDILSSIKLLEEEIDGFVSGSYFEVGKETPGGNERWNKVDYGWDLEEGEEETEDPWDDEAYWENEWDEWNEEWN